MRRKGDRGEGVRQGRKQKGGERTKREVGRKRRGGDEQKGRLRER